MSLQYVVAPGESDELVVGVDDIISQSPARTHTGLSDLKATTVELRELDEYAKRQARLNVDVDGVTKWTGFLVNARHNTRRGTTEITADGIAKRLQETRPDYDSLGGSLTYTQTSLEEALRDYWARTPFDNYSVTPQSTEPVATDAQLQFANLTSEFNDILSIPDDKPVVVDNGDLKYDRVSEFIEGENSAGNFNVVDTTAAGVDFSNFEAAKLSGSGDSVEDSVTFNHVVPEGEIGIRSRASLDNFDGTVALKIDGDRIQDFSYGGVSDTISWRFGLGSIGPELDTTSHDYAIEVTSYNSGSITIDCWSVYDQRFNYTFDNTVDTNFYTLAGPEEYPADETVAFDPASASFNITEATVNITESDSRAINEIAVSKDGGSTFQTATNTNNATFSIGEAREITVRLKPGAFTNDNTVSPTNRDATKKIAAYELLVDGNDLVVIDELKLSRNHFENLQQLHGYGQDWNFTIEHDGGAVSDMVVKSYQEGDETRAKPQSFNDPEEENPEVQAESYFNSIYLQGALDANGDRPVAEIKDNDAISNDDREISPGVLRDPKVTTQDGAVFRARALLETATSNNDLVGEKVVPSDTLIEPGYSYPVDFGDGEREKTLEEVSLTESPDNVQVRARFSTPKSDLSAQLQDLQRNSRDIGDNV